MSVVERAVKAIPQQDQLDSLADAIQRGIGAVYGAGGAVARSVQDFLHGTWLGHPLHSALTDVPIGAWSTGVVLDALANGHGRRGMERAADAAVGLGIAGAVGAAVTGLTDWQHTDGEPRRTGLLHAMGNTVALALFTTSFLLRKRGLRPAGRMTARGGLAVMLVAAYLGGRMVYRDRTGVNHADPEAGPQKFVPVLPDKDLKHGEPRRVEADGTPIVLARQDEQICALDARCSHLGGPLEEGDLDQGSVRCPWHGSRFALADGRVLDGPAVFPQPCFETRVRGGQIEVRRARG